MKFLLIIAFWLLRLNASSAQQLKPACPFPCASLHVWEYRPGMRFYFPTTKSQLDINPVYTEFTQLNPCSGDTLKTVSYEFLAGKTFEIIEATNSENKSFHGGNHFIYTFILKNTNCPERFSYSVVLDKRRFSTKKESQNVADGFFIRGAISLDELEQSWKFLVDRKFYTLFPFKGKRDELVTITKVEAGTWETPIRLHMRTDEVADTTIDVTICGTNVPGSYVKDFQFSLIFSCESKRGNIKPDQWEVIRRGIPKLGMSPNEVQSTLGKPKEIKKNMTDKTNTVTYTYSGYLLFFENDKLIKIESDS